MNNCKRITTDYLVIGTGIAGLTSALELAEAGEVTVLSKESFAESNTRYAQGGIATAWAKEDSPEMHYQDTIKAGAGLCTPCAVDILVSEAKEQIEKLVAWGVEFDKNNENFALTKEGGHSKSRILHAGGDATGKEISNKLVEQVRQHPQIKGQDNSFVVDLITEDNRCYGAYVYDKEADEYLLYQSRAVILATGGSGQLYSFTSNPEVATGDGIAMAYRAGAEVMDLEMMQFHPTVLNIEDADEFLISEAVRGEGAKLRTANGQRFMSEYHESAELAPRDIVARAIKQELVEQEEDYVYLDLTELGADFIKSRFPTIYQNCLALGIDISQDYIPVKPAAHYFMGGIKINIDAQTSVQRLYACGETACLAVHGANRLASNSLLEGLVYGHRAAEKIKEEDYKLVTEFNFNSAAKINKSDIDLTSLKRKLQNLMMSSVGIIRKQNDLQTALREIEEKLQLLELRLTEVKAWEVQNMLTVAYLIMKSTLLRTESRGAHYRINYPQSRAEWKKHIVIQRQNEWRAEKIEFKETSSFTKN
ncbi:L-aspartate oxidase [Halanaerobacter jeridensis]|uniref:L-aspartate oxidase n=2 Tax=Halanaerobacter jeridensis TaxID=706427 RepID=A0A938XP36_9FIRM|nr:L-aspartate oxidase [Halanaerobacter jeridensis]